jgi:hypothetical protein
LFSGFQDSGYKVEAFSLKQVELACTAWLKVAGRQDIGNIFSLLQPTPADSSWTGKLAFCRLFQPCLALFRLVQRCSGISPPLLLLFGKAVKAGAVAISYFD